MITTKIPPRRSKARGSREDGLATKAALLDAAAIVFAEHGFDRATAKEITLRAATNSAAVSYHFGGIEGLYQEVLVRAHDQLLSLRELQDLMSENLAARDKLRKLCAILAEVIIGPKSNSWAIRVIGREVLAPSPHFEILRQRQFEPKKMLVFRLIAELLQCPTDDPAVSRCFINFMAPCVLMLLMDRRLLYRALPAFKGTDSPSLAQHLTDYALGGISALAQHQASDKR